MLFPAPVGPQIPSICPGRSVKLTFSSVGRSVCGYENAVIATSSTPRPSGTDSLPSFTTGASASIARIRLYAALPRSTILNIHASASIGQIISPRYMAKLVN
ncbi:hypothetical protein D3C81_1791700 [compost metagenome]